MQKKFGAVALTVALGLLLSGVSFAGITYKSEQLRIRTNIGSAVQTDSMVATIGGGNSADTTTSFGMVINPSWNDSLGIVVKITPGAALGTGESLYVALDGSVNNGTSWVQVTDNGVILAGYSVAASMKPVVTSHTVTFLPTPLLSTHASGGASASANTYPGGWGGYDLLRLRLRTSVNGMVANTYRVRVYYPAFE